MKVAVLGGGIQGCTVALELAHRGASVEIFESRAELLTGASRFNEGKIHYGFVYANDETLRSAHLMVRGTNVFRPLLRQWIGDAVDSLATSSPFIYAVHRDSLRDVDLLAARYHRIAAIIDRARLEDVGPVPIDPAHVRRLEQGELHDYGPDILAAFETAEVAIDPEQLCDAVGDAVTQHPAIVTHTFTKVVAVDPRSRRLFLEDLFDSTREPHHSRPFDHIVNCTWNGRPKIDASIGIRPSKPWSFRMKYFVRIGAGSCPIELPTTTAVLGSFGDIVDFGGGRFYLSWYPAGRRGWSTELEAPAWPSRLADAEAQGVAGDIVRGLTTVVPRVGLLADAPDRSCSVNGGVIYALGHTDLSDPESGLHERFDVGPHSSDRYHTVDTGKLTLAPLFATIVADRIAGRA